MTSIEETSKPSYSQDYSKVFDSFNEFGVIDFLRNENLHAELNIFQQCLNILSSSTFDLHEITKLFENLAQTGFAQTIKSFIESDLEWLQKVSYIKKILISRIRLKYGNMPIGFGSSAMQTEQTPRELSMQDRTSAMRMLVLISRQIYSAADKGDVEAMFFILNRNDLDKEIVGQFVNELKIMDLTDKNARKTITQKYANIAIKRYQYWQQENISIFQPGEALMHDELDQFAKYINLMKEVGVNSYRMSIRWTKVIDENGVEKPEGLKLYKEQVRMLKSAGIEPLIVLHHFDMLPGDHWMQEGFKDRFHLFAETVLTALIPEGVTKWIPINEPAVLSGSLYILGMWYPFIKNRPDLHFRALKHMSDATQDFYALAHQIAQENKRIVEVILSSNLSRFNIDETKNDMKTNLLKRIRPTLEHFDRLYLWLVGKKSMDAIGIQYYWSYDLNAIHQPIDFAKMKNDPSTGPIDILEDGSERHRAIHGNLLEPQYLLDVIVRTWEIFHKPIYITEFGANISALRPEEKIWYFKESVHAILIAMALGIPIKGFWGWTLIRNFEIIGVFGGGYESNFGYAAEAKEAKLNNFMTQDKSVASELREFIKDLENKFPDLGEVITEQLPIS